VPSTNLDLRQLIVLQTLWDTRNVTMTARRLNLSQPAVSASLNRLREATSDRLFIWNGQTMVPTARMEMMIGEVSEIITRLQALTGPEGGAVSSFRRHYVVAAADYVAALLAPGLLQRLGESSSEAVCEFVELRPALLNKGNAVQIDLFIAPRGRLALSGLRSQSLYRDEYVCIGRKGNRRLLQGMDAGAFLALPHIGFTAVPRVLVSHETSLWSTGMTSLRYRLMSAQYLSFPPIVCRSNVVAIVPRRLLAVAGGTSDLTCITPPVPLPDIDMCMLWDDALTNDRAHRWLRQTIVDMAAALEAHPSPDGVSSRPQPPVAGRGGGATRPARAARAIPDRLRTRRRPD
jgi:DNA-binding transcriptional LysR family regulator